ncbi:MAG: response regulator [Pirellulales bacterium]|nr:response regulator [Pirellulales bacterium]
MTARTTAANTIAADISPLKQAETSLRASEERYRQLFENDMTGVFIADDEGKLIATNPAFRRMFGFSNDESLYGASLCDLLEDEGDRWTLAEALRRGESISLRQLRCRRADGAPLTVRANLVTTCDTAGQLERLLGYVLDETQLHLLEDQYRQSQKMEALGRLAGGVAHDFNNMLTIILGYCDVLGEELSLGQPGRNSVLEIDSAARRAASLTKQLLAFSRQQVLRPQVVDLNGVAQGIHGMLQRVIGEDVSLALSLDNAALSILADPGQLEQVLMNLAINARDAMPQGGLLEIVTRRLEICEGSADVRFPELPQGHYATLSVTDTGCGMDEATRSRMFEPFFTTKELGHGTGLGLATVYGIVAQSGGRIHVASEMGHGTSFTLAFPLHAGNSIETCEEPQRISERGHETILLVEDEDGVRDLVQRLLMAHGYHVIAAGSGAEALRIASELGQRLDLLLTDIVMPDMNGRKVAEQMIPYLVDPKRVLYMTGYTNDAILRNGVSEQNRQLLQKPFSPQVLTAMIRNILDPGGAGLPDKGDER